MKRSLSLLPLAAVAVSAGFAAAPPSGGPGVHPAAAVRAPSSIAATAAARTRALQAIASLPPTFELNDGQTNSDVRFLSRGRDSTAFFTPQEVVMSLAGPASTGGTSPAVLRLRVVGASPTVRLDGVERLSGVSNSIIGNDPSRWHGGVPTFGEVAYREILPKTDLVFHGGPGGLEYDFDLAPGADPRAITMVLTGAQSIALDAGGNLLVQTPAGVVRHDTPRIYQDVDGVRRTVSGGYQISGPDRIGFRVGQYDLTRPLVIDPTLSYSTTEGGTATDAGNAVAVDGSGNAYFTGFTYSSNFPTAAPAGFAAYQPSCGGTSGGTCSSTASTFMDGVSTGGSAVYTSATAVFTSRLVGTSITGTNIPAGTTISAVNSTSSVTLSNNATATGAGLTFTINTPLSDAFVAKVDSNGAVVYSTYLGGNGDDVGRGIAVDSSGNAYVTGSTGSTDFPTKSPYQSACGGLVPNPTVTTCSDAFMTKLNPSGSALLYSTYLGGSGDDVGNGIAVDSSGGADVTGTTTSADLFGPLGGNGFQPRSVCSGLPSRLPCNGSDAFLARFDTTGASATPLLSLTYSTYLGGTGTDRGLAVAVASPSAVFITGMAGFDADFPVTVGAYETVRMCGGTLSVLCVFPDAFLAEFDTTTPGPSSLKYSTYLGPGDASNVGFGVATWTSSGTTYAYVTGVTYARDFPVKTGAYQTSLKGTNDAFVVKLKPAGGGSSDLIYATYLGGTAADQGNAIAVDGSGNAYLTGQTTSTDFPTAGATIAGTGGTFVSKIDPAGGGASDLVWSTYLGSSYDSGNGVAVDGSGNAFVTGPKSGDAYVAKVMP